ncbi:LOW QUALITY PROTEIN: ferritin heavy chain-like [Rhinolophus ferrumequinum]|uniref:LOW QUALITY PROTEIN: ferritin heavy chain-like n=1 Tax=Rhinolophus ferrumequinum TaxID=59479 RepID=UPI00140FDFAA|nr:LOW QUALITY PROTEIN: ferritin heavy chain-like [Rhinolophus ferrumequinum]
MASVLQLIVTTSAPPVMTPLPPATMLALTTTTPELPALMPVLPVVMSEPPATPSQVRENYHPNCRAAVTNRQINLELYASYVYLCMDFYFDCQDVALKHLGPFFLQHSRVERDQAERLMRPQNKCGGHIRLRNIRKPDCDCWENGLKSMKCALYLEKSVNQSLLKLHQLATSKKEAHLCDFLEHHYLGEAVTYITEWSVHITNQRKLGSSESSLAEHLLDKLTLDDSDKNCALDCLPYSHG